jgi:hypothetical protein
MLTKQKLSPVSHRAPDIFSSTQPTHNSTAHRMQVLASIFTFCSQSATKTMAAGTNAVAVAVAIAGGDDDNDGLSPLVGLHRMRMLMLRKGRTILKSSPERKRSMSFSLPSFEKIA